MSIQYSSLSIVNTTFTTTTGTRLEIVNGIANALSSAGWTNISGAGTGDQTWESATTPQGYAIRTRLYDPGSGNCAQAFLHNATGSLTATTPSYLLPTAGDQWRVICQGYQWFAFVPGFTTARKFACCGVPYVFPFLTSSITAIGFMQGNMQSDTDASTRPSFRTVLYSSTGMQAGLINAALWSSGAPLNSSAGQIHLAATYGASSRYLGAYNWLDGSTGVVDPWIAFGTTVTTQGTILGQLWDSAILTDAYLSDYYPMTIDSKPNWYGVTVNNTGTLYIPRATLFVLAG